MVAKPSRVLNYYTKTSYEKPEIGRIKEEI